MNLTKEDVRHIMKGLEVLLERTESNDPDIGNIMELFNRLKWLEPEHGHQYSFDLCRSGENSQSLGVGYQIQSL